MRRLPGNAGPGLRRGVENEDAGDGPAPGVHCVLWSKRTTDVCTWVWCSDCALCQEIRTADQYQVEETSYVQAPDAEAGGPAVVAPEGMRSWRRRTRQMSPNRTCRPWKLSQGRA